MFHELQAGVPALRRKIAVRMGSPIGDGENIWNTDTAAPYRIDTYNKSVKYIDEIYYKLNISGKQVG